MLLTRGASQINRNRNVFLISGYLGLNHSLTQCSGVGCDLRDLLWVIFLPESSSQYSFIEKVVLVCKTLTA